MVLALCCTAIVIGALLAEVLFPRIEAVLDRRRARRLAAERQSPLMGYDPGRERRAEQRARQLLQSCVNAEEWAMYRDLGFIRVWGRQAGLGSAGAPKAAGAVDGAPYAYLIYPHKPVVAFVPQTRRLLNEYCVEFPDETRPYGSARLPDSDDVLAKWMALTGDERGLIGRANMHLPGRQVDPRQVRRDLWRLSEWERERTRAKRSRGGSVPTQ
ncbi:MAG TPA: hypothetical protein VK279_07965 [Solirubrobacteraceae bacterium]|nr:hypothetical protein [Solirubrobacteraceae bacterium]